jgi:hypothetical protein
MTDILADWKTQRFVVIDYPTVWDNDVARTAILTDIDFWVEHIDQLDQWCKDNSGAQRTGMTVTLDTPEALLLFTLRWT